MKLIDEVKVYKNMIEIQESIPTPGEFFVYVDDEREGKIYVEKFGKRCLGTFFNMYDAIKYARFRKQEGDINSLFEKYERKCSQLSNVVSNLDLTLCKKCQNYHHKDHICYICGYDRSTGLTHDKNRGSSSGNPSG